MIVIGVIVLNQIPFIEIYTNNDKYDILQSVTVFLVAIELTRMRFLLMTFATE